MEAGVFCENTLSCFIKPPFGVSFIAQSWIQAILYKDIEQKEYFDCKAILFAMKLTCGIARYDVKTPRLEKEEIHFCIRTIYDIIYKLEMKKWTRLSSGPEANREK